MLANIIAARNEDTNSVADSINVSALLFIALVIRWLGIINSKPASIASSLLEMAFMGFCRYFDGSFCNLACSLFPNSFKQILEYQTPIWTNFPGVFITMLLKTLSIMLTPALSLRNAK